MFLRMAKRLLFETDKRLSWKLAWNMGFKGMLSVQKHKARLRRGQVFPPFLHVSIRFAKRHWFNDFGAYRGQNHARESAPAILASRNKSPSSFLPEPAGNHGVVDGSGLNKQLDNPHEC